MDDRRKTSRPALIAQERHEILEGAGSRARGARELEEGAAATEELLAHAPCRVLAPCDKSRRREIRGKWVCMWVR